MAHWPYEYEREDGDGYDETYEDVVKARKWLRNQADRSRDPFIRDLMGDLRWLELQAEPFFLGLDEDSENRDDVDEIGPF